MKNRLLKIVLSGIMTLSLFGCGKSADKIANQYNVEMPITEQCYHVLYEGKNPRQALYDLMERPKQHETERVWLK